MIFIKADELRVGKFQSLINDISEDDNTILSKIEGRVIGMIKGYTRGRFDIDYMLTKTDENRDELLLGLITDYMIYHLWKRTNANEIPSNIRETYDENTVYLEKVAKGTISPDWTPLDRNVQQSTMIIGSSTSKFNNIDY